jgi:MATE family multidrug resistance protein
MSTFGQEARATLRLAIPITIGQLSQLLMGITDSVMIGRTGTVPLAASAFGAGVFNVFFLFGIGLLVPVAVFVSRARGAGRHDEASEYLRHGLATALVAGGVEVGMLLALSRHLAWFGQPPEVLAVVNPFFILIGLSLLPALGHLALRQFAESMGRPWLPTNIMLAGVVLNAFLDWVLIYGHCGAPALGLTGAGIATLVSRILSAAAIFLWLRLDPHTRPAWPARWRARLSRPLLTEMLHVGVPASGGLLFEGGAFGAATIMMGWLGAAPLAAHQVALSCTAVTFMISLGFAMALGMRISAALGAGESGRLRLIWYSGAGMGAATNVFMAVVFVLFGRRIAAGFDSDPRVIDTATLLLVISGVFEIFDGGQVINSSALRGLSDVKVPAVITFVAYWVIALPVGYLLAFHSGMRSAGVWTGLALGLAVAWVFLGLRFLRLTRPGAPPAAA